METRYQFNRMELAGSLGDLGTLLPIVVGMILINGLSPTTVFLAFGLFYLLTGFYYRLPIPVQPLKAVGAIAIAYPNQITESVIGAGGILFGVLLLVLSVTGTVDRLAKLFTQPVVRRIQLALGLIFLKKGIELIVTQKVFLSGVAGRLSEYPTNLIIGFIVFTLVLALLDNKKFPAGLFGAVPMCHGTGGLAAHYRFGARTGDAPLMIGSLFIVLGLVLGELGFAILALLPNSVLGVLLIFAGLELCPLVRSLQTNEEFFVALLIAGIALAVPNMAWAFGIGIVVNLFLRKTRTKI